MEFRILGPVEAYESGVALPLGPYKQRGVLVALLIHANEVVSTDDLIDALWGQTPPEGAPNTLQVYISQIRKVLESGAARSRGSRLITRSPGYVLHVGADELDLYRFEQLVSEGRRALEEGVPEIASVKLRRALAMWRGGALADFTYEPFAQETITRTEGLRTGAIEERIEADLRLGRHAELVAELEGLVTTYPLRERLWGQLMLALYRSGRQAEALQAYQRARGVLVDELGIDPGPSLQRLERAILNQDPALELTPALDMPPAIPSSTQGGPEGELASALEGSQTADDGASDVSAIARRSALEPVARRGHIARPRIRRRRLVAAGLAFAVLAVVLAGALMFAGRSSRTASPTRADTVAAIDPNTNAVVTDAAVGSGPWGLAVGEGAVWVANVDDGTVSRVDPATGSETARQGQVGTPTGIAVGEGRVWVADGFADTVFEIDPQLNEVVRTLEIHARGIAVGYGAVWITDDIRDQVLRLDPQTLQVEATIRLRSGTSPTAIAAGSGGVWVVGSLDRTVARIDPATNTVAAGQIALCCQPTGIAAGAGAVWVTSASTDKVLKIDPASNRVALTIGVGDGPTGVAAGTDAVWVANTRGGTVYRLDQAGEIVSRIELDGHPRGVAIGDRLVWVAIGRN